MVKETNGTVERPRNVSITQKLLTKTYGENCPEELWPTLVDDGGYVILGSEPTYDEYTCTMGEENPAHTWCRWGWDMGSPVRFDSRVDAEVFVKTLNWNDERGRSYARGYIPHVAFAGEGTGFERDTALPNGDSEEDYED